MKKLTWNTMLYMFLLIVTLIIAFPNANALLDHKEVSTQLSLNYPIIFHKDIFGQQVSKQTLTEHTEQCLINCQSKVQIELNYEGVLIDDLKFIGSSENNVDIKYSLQIERQRIVYDQSPNETKQVCEDVLNKNTSKIENICHDEIISYKSVPRIENYSEEYKLGQSEKAGIYNILILANKEIGQRIDWQIKSQGIWNEEQAWWDSNWIYKQEISNLTGFKVYLNITKSANMNATFSDLRFTNSSENAELVYYIRGYDANSAQAEILTNNETSVYMYYGNTAVDSTSSFANDYGANVWRAFFMEETAGNVIDSSYQGNGTAVTVAQGATGKIGNAINFTTGGVTLGAKLTNSPITYSSWFKIFANSTATQLLLDSDDGGYDFGVYIVSSIGLRNITWNNAAAEQRSTLEPVANTWYHITISLNATASWIYVNGVLLNTKSGGTTGTGNNYVLGKHSSAGVNYLNGTLDEVIIYNRAVTSTEARYLYILPQNAVYGVEKLSKFMTVLISKPLNNSNFSTASVGIGCNFTSGGQNVSTVMLNVTNSLGSQAYSNIIDNSDNPSYNATWTFSSSYDDTYNIECIGYGSAGENDTENGHIFTIDLTAPLVIIDYPLSANYSTNVTELNWTAGDIHLSKCWYSLDLGTTNITMPCGTNLTGNASIEGYNTWKVWANDSFGNQNEASVIFFKDTIYPNINVTYPTSDGQTFFSMITLNYTVSDANLQSCWWTNNSGATNNSIICGMNITQTWNQGNNTVIVYANDTVGNENSSTREFNIDTTFPSDFIVFPSSDGQWFNRMIEINHTASDPYLPLGICKWTNNSGLTNHTLADCGTNITGQTWLQGINNVTIYVGDVFGNENSSTREFNIDTVYPNIAFNETIGCPKDGAFQTSYNFIPWIRVTELNSFTINWTLTDWTMAIIESRTATGSVATNLGISPTGGFTVPSDGLYYYNSTICDIANNCNMTEMRNITIDTISPSLSIVYPINTTYINILGTSDITELNYTVSDINPLEVSCIYTINDGTPTPVVTGENITGITSSAGSNRFSILCSDIAGNTNQSNVTFYLNNINPVLNITASVVESQIQTVYFNLTATILSQSNATLDYNGVLTPMPNIYSNSTFAQYSLTFITLPYSNPIVNISVLYYANNLQYMTDNQTQSISTFLLGYCNTTISYPILNFTFKDEISGNILNATANQTNFAATFNYKLSNSSVYKNYSFFGLNTENSTFAFCINNATLSLNAEMESIYSASGYTERYYYLSNATLTNNTSFIDLFLLPSGSSTKFTIDVHKGVTLIKNALITVQKYSIGEGNYQTISIRKTDINGQFIEYFEIDKQYQFSVVQNGNPLGIVQLPATCQATPCSMLIQLASGAGDIFSPINDTFAQNVQSSLIFNPITKMVTYTFVDTTGLAHYFRLEVDKGSMNLSKMNICDNTTYSSAGTMTCNLSGQGGDFFAIGYLSRSPEKIDKYISIAINLIKENWGIMLIFFDLVIIITIVFAGAALSRGNPSVIIFSLMLAMLGLKLAEMLPFSWVIIAVIEILGFILIGAVRT